MSCTRPSSPGGTGQDEPDGVYGRVAPRSGLAVKHCINVGAGVIDPDYTGEVKVVLFCLVGMSWPRPRRRGGTGHDEQDVEEYGVGV